MNKIELKCEI